MPASDTVHSKSPSRRSQPGAIAARPFLKWPGGKAQLLPYLLPRVPKQFRSYYEPFAGGAAVYFALAAETGTHVSVLNDLNEYLVTTYRVVRDDPHTLDRLLARHQKAYLARNAPKREEYYYEVRNSIPASDTERAARFIFLNKTCYNGLYRENRKREFNVPHGRYANPAIHDAPVLRRASETLQRTVLLSVDFTDALSGAGAGDFVYLDPPFEPLSPTSSFTSYTGRGFGRADQERLKELVDTLTTRGVLVMLSNSSHPWIQELYADGQYRQDFAPARRAINVKGDRRGPIPELVVLNYPAEFERQLIPDE